MKLHLPKLLLTAVLAVCSVADAAVTTEDSISVGGTTYTGNVSIMGGTGDLTENNLKGVDYIVFTPDRTEVNHENPFSTTYTNDSGENVTSTPTIVLSSYKAPATAEQINSGQLWINVWNKQTATLTNDVILGSSRHAEGALRLHESQENKKIILTGDITLVENALISAGGGDGDGRHNYLEGYISGAGKTLTLNHLNGNTSRIVMSGGAEIGTLAGNIKEIAFSATKSDGTGATSTSYTIGNLTSTASVNVNAGVSVAVTQSANITGATITNSGTITLSGTVAIGGTNGNADITLLEEITQGTETGAFSHGDNGWKTRSGGSYYLIKASGENAVVTLNDGAACSNGTLDASEKGSLKVTGIGSAYDRNTTYYANTGTSTLRTTDAPSFVVAKGAELVFSDAMPTGNKTLNVTGEGKLKVTMQNGNSHGSSISLDDGFTGTLSIAGGKMELRNFRYNGEVVLELISGQNWDNVTIDNEVRLSAAGIDSSYDFAYSNIDISGKVTGNYLRVTDPEGKGGYLKLTNSANDIEQVKVTGRDFYFEAGKLGTLTATGGTSHISGGSLGNLISTGGTVNITGTVSIGGGADFDSTHVSGIYLKENGTVNIGDGTTTNTVTVTRVEMGDNQSANGGVLNVKSNATLVITGGDVTTGDHPYHKTGFLLGEWESASTVNVAGKLLAENATLFVGNMTANIVVNNGGIMAVKGIGLPAKIDKTREINLTLNDGGKIVLGEAGINTSKPFSGVLGAGTIGISADAAINTALALKSTTGTTFDTQKYVWGEGGASIAQGTEGGTLRISGAISDHSVTTTEGEGDSATTTKTNYPGKLVKAGAGTLELSGANTYSGGTDINAGTVKTGHTSALGEGAVSVAEGASLELGASLTVSDLTIEEGGSLIFGNGTKLTVTGTLTLTSANDIKLAEGFTFSSADEVKLATGTLALGEGFDATTWAGAGTCIIGGVEYTSSLKAEGDAISVTFKQMVEAPGEPISVTGWALDGTALTLNVNAALSEGMEVSVHLLDDATMKDILGKLDKENYTDGKPMVTITLQGTNEGGIITADKMNEVVFVKGDTGQNYWGEMVGNQLMYNVERIPEPTTATLSLLALMGLAARRRRQK